MFKIPDFSLAPRLCKQAGFWRKDFDPRTLVSGDLCHFDTTVRCAAHYARAALSWRLTTNGWVVSKDRVSSFLLSMFLQTKLVVEVSMPPGGSSIGSSGITEYGAHRAIALPPASAIGSVHALVQVLIKMVILLNLWWRILLRNYHSWLSFRLGTTVADSYPVLTSHSFQKKNVEKDLFMDNWPVAWYPNRVSLGPVLCGKNKIKLPTV